MDINVLKEVATNLGISFNGNIGFNTLLGRVETKCKELETTLEEEIDKMDTKLQEETKPAAKAEKKAKITFASLALAQKKKKKPVDKQKEATKLVRCIVTCNNKNKISHQGEIFTARNAVMPEISKYVHYGVPYHVPQILLNVIREKKYQMFRIENRNGKKIKVSFMVPEYNIQLLEDISMDELKAIKQRQLVDTRED